MIKEYPCIKNVYIISQVCFQIKFLIFFISEQIRSLQVFESHELQSQKSHPPGR